MDHSSFWEANCATAQRQLNEFRRHLTDISELRKKADESLAKSRELLRRADELLGRL